MWNIDVSFAGNLTNSSEIFRSNPITFGNFEVGNKKLSSALIDVLHALLESNCFISAELFSKHCALSCAW